MPMPSGAPISIWDLFQHADLVVKLVMIGLLVASVAVWAIAIEKLILYSRTRRAMDGFEQAFWSGQSLEELYRALASRPTHSMAALFVAAMREWKRSLEGQPRSFAGLPLCRPVRDRLGDHDELSGDRRPAVHLAGGGGPRHRRGPVRDRNRPHRRHTGDHFL